MIKLQISALNGAATKQPNGGLSSMESAARLVELQEACERLKQDLANSMQQCSEMSSRFV